MRRLSWASSALLLAGACAGSPSAPPQADQQAKQLQAAARRAEAALYVYRSGLMGMLRPLDVSLAGGASAQLGYNTFILVDGPPGQIEYRLQGRRQHRQRPGPDPGRPDAFRRGVDEGRPLVAELRDRRSARLRSGPGHARALRGGGRRVRAALSADMNVPSGSPLNRMRPTVLEMRLARLDLLRQRMDVAEAALERRAEEDRRGAGGLVDPVRRLLGLVDGLRAGEPHAGAVGRADRLDLVGAAVHVASGSRPARRAPSRYRPRGGRRRTGRWDCRRGARDTRGVLVAASSMKASSMARAMPSATAATPQA